MQAKTGYDALVVYAWPDVAIAEEVARLLASAGLTVWLDRWCLVPGAPWEGEFEGAVDSSQCVVVLVGVEASDGHAGADLRVVLHRLTSDRPPRVIPVLLPGTVSASVPEALRPYRWVDLRDGTDDATAIDRLVAAVCDTPGAGEAWQARNSLRALSGLADDPPVRDPDRDRRFGAEHPDAITSASNLALTLADRGDLASARTLQERVLNALTDALGPDHPTALTGANNLAGTLYAQADLAGARALQEQVLAARIRVLGPEHPETLTSAGNLAGTLYAQGDLAGARALQERVLDALT